MVNVAPAAVLPTSNVMPGPVMPRAAIVPALVFDPRTLGNLALWLDARYPNGLGGTAPADGTAVSQWNDLSGNGRHVTQGTGANQPLYRSANPNLLTYNQASVETNTTGLMARGTGFAIARSTSQSMHGSASVQITVPTGTIQNDWGVSVGTGTSDYVPVTVGKTYTGVAWVKTPSASGTLTIQIFWRTEAGATITAVLANSTGTGVWQQLSVTGVAPATAAFAQLVVSYQTPSTVWYADAFGVWEGSSTTWVPPVTLPAGMPVVQFDGANDNMTFTSLNLLSLSGVTLYAVAETPPGATGASPLVIALQGAGATNRAALFLTSSGAVTVWSQRLVTDSADSFVTSGSSAAGSHVYSTVVDYSAASVLFSRDGSTQTDTPTWSAGSSDGTNAITNAQVASGAWDGGLAAILVFTTAHDATTRQRVERWLGRVYGVTVA